MEERRAHRLHFVNHRVDWEHMNGHWDYNNGRREPAVGWYGGRLGRELRSTCTADPPLPKSAQLKHAADGWRSCGIQQRGNRAQ